MSIVDSMSKVGVYADVPNLYRTGGQRLQYDVLREFACRDAAEPLRLNAYATFDVDRAKRDDQYRGGALSFHSKLRDYGYKVIVKEVSGDSDERSRDDALVDLAVDSLTQSERLDRVLIASGERDLIKVVRSLQARGCRVEIVALDDCSPELREEADLFIPGHLIPNLVPIGGRPAPAKRDEWGEVGSRVRGWAYWFEQERGFGYMRFLKTVDPGLWLTDARHPDSPYETAFFRSVHVPQHVRAERLPGRSYVFEFTLEPSEKNEGLQATEIEVVAYLSEPRAELGNAQQSGAFQRRESGTFRSGGYQRRDSGGHPSGGQGQSGSYPRRDSGSHRPVESQHDETDEVFEDDDA
ncbi:MAG: NYN domain-containing protein [Acidobacteriota bacterium]